MFSENFEVLQIESVMKIDKEKGEQYLSMDWIWQNCQYADYLIGTRSLEWEK